VHGSNSIPNYPASHGCVRISVPAMDMVWETNLMPMSTPVWVHEGV
jgi:lipoprotein-anchoring transpeptidase ErfK/SrfK